MLSEAEKREIDSHLREYEQRRGVVIDALKIVQRRQGWVSDEAVRDVADYLDLTPAEVDGVGTFYSHIYRRPVGRHVISICDSVVCWMMGCDNLLQRLSDRLKIGLGQTTSDGRFTLLPNGCLGCCDHAPAMMIDEDLHVNLTPEKIDAILETYA
jgi:NADH-quinone oxidoreductase subunit E